MKADHIRGWIEFLGIAAALVSGGCSWNDSPPPLHSRLYLEKSDTAHYTAFQGLVDTNSNASTDWASQNIYGQNSTQYGAGAGTSAGGVSIGGAAGGATSSTAGNPGATSGNINSLIGPTTIQPLGSTPTQTTTGIGTSSTTGTGTIIGGNPTAATPGTTTGTVGTGFSSGGAATRTPAVGTSATSPGTTTTGAPR